MPLYFEEIGKKIRPKKGKYEHIYYLCSWHTISLEFIDLEYYTIITLKYVPTGAARGVEVNSFCPFIEV